MSIEIVHAEAGYISPNGKDLCVTCGEETPYDTATPIAAREHYVEGAGQLCGGCNLKIYGPVLVLCFDGKEERLWAHHDGS